MAQEFTIKSQEIEDKINQLLPSQGGFQAGVDFSASTMVIPIVDLTETAEGSSLRQDLQSSLSHDTITSFSVSNTSTTIINTTGYFRIFGSVTFQGGSIASINITDGTTNKILLEYNAFTNANYAREYDFLVKLAAGDSVVVTSSNTNSIFDGNSRQIASLAGNLTNP
jgi:hypothetical protein